MWRTQSCVQRSQSCERVRGVRGSASAGEFNDIQPGATGRVIPMRNLPGCLRITAHPLRPRSPVGGGGGATGGSVGVPSTRNTLPPSTNAPDYSQRPMFLSGKVTLDDGTPPPDSAVLQITCGSNPRSVARTDSHGNFSVDLNNRSNAASFADASQSSWDSYPGGSSRGSSSSAAGTSNSMCGMGNIGNS